MLIRNLPSVVYHADWGTNPHKRWIAKAVFTGNKYVAYAPVPVGEQTTLMERINTDTGRGDIAIVGFDFPIGIPCGYARLAGITEFKTFLMNLGQGDWAGFYDVCRTASEISICRPFYPYKPGGTKHLHLLSALGFTNINELRRQCDLKHSGRRAACPLFWTLGANQVGKGAIVGWRDVLAPALRSHQPVMVWPFDGGLDELLQPGRATIVETYPAECYGWFFSEMPKGKGKAEVRKQTAEAMFAWARSANVKLDPEMKTLIEQGFPDGDDSFDAAIGLFGMLEVVTSRRGSGEPGNDSTTKLEGWILGQEFVP